MKFKETETVFATASGFIYEYENWYYLITNAHNITRMNTETNQRICNHAGFPDMISLTCFRVLPDNDKMQYRSEPFSVDLYHGDENHTMPTWYMHPIHGYNVDVVAVPIIEVAKMPKFLRFNPINKQEFVSDEFSPRVSDDVFVLGYPMDFVETNELPIWKRASIATEPFFDYQKLPKILIDTATRSGMSGSPVIYQRHGIHFKDGSNQLRDDSFLGTLRGFLGIYSGRIGNDEFKVQLGIVWKKVLIDEILAAKVIGSIEFQKL